MVIESTEKLIFYPNFLGNRLKDKQFPSYHPSKMASKTDESKLEEPKMEEVKPIATKTKKLAMFEFQAEVVWINAIGFFFVHLAGFYGIYLSFSELFRGEFATFIWMAIMTFLGGEGITIGAHRLWTHRSFKATTPLQIILIICQALAGQNCCFIWVRDHRQHHKYSDTDADPHNARRGFFFSHIGWLMMKKHPEVIKKGKGIDMSDLEANPIVMFQKKYYKSLFFVFAIIIPALVPVYFWNEPLMDSLFISFFARYIIQLNMTWSVNSVAHMFGTRPYDKNILPVESAFVSFIGLGEGWHNYHHAFPWDYKASEFGMSLNGTTRIIEFFAKIGWAYDLREASRDLMIKKIERCGDGTHPLYSAENFSKEAEEIVAKEYQSKHLGRELEDESQLEDEDSSKNKECNNNNNFEESNRLVIEEIKDAKNVCDNKKPRNRNNSNSIRQKRQLLHGY